MKPILFESDSTTFTTKGLGTLSDAISCVVTEERNGAYELTMEYPIDGIHAELLTHSRIIFAKPFDGGNNQAFRIYDVTKPINGILTISAEHISYQLGMIPCGMFSADNVAQAFDRLSANLWENCPFTFWTNKTTYASYNQEVPASVRSRLGGTEGSFLDVFGGEYEWDNYVVKLHDHRGNDNNVRLNYGKNITDINQEENIASTITGIVPYYKGSDDEDIIYLPEHVVYSSHATDFPYHRTEVVDFSSDFDEAPTVSQLRSKAQSYITSNNIGIPSVNIEVEFVPLWQTEEYKNVAMLERVKLCDTVHVYFEKLNINVDAKVIKTEYDVLLERYNKIELGQMSKSISGDISKMNTGITNQISKVARKSKSDIQKAVDNATELITGGLGGHVILKQNADGEPEEILIMDTDDTQTAVNVIRMNQNGIGFSTTGYSGTYTTAWTIDGNFVADFITSGKLKSIDVEAVNMTSSTIDGTTITGGTINVSSGKFEVQNNGNVTAEHISVKDVYASQFMTIHTNTPTNGGLYTNGRLTSEEGIYCNKQITAQGNLNSYADCIFGSQTYGHNHKVVIDTLYGFIRCDFAPTHADIIDPQQIAEKAHGVYLGSTTYPFRGVYTIESPTVLSDREKKKNIKLLDEKYCKLFTLLKPSQFSYKIDDDLLHIGFIAQDVEDALDEVGIDSKDFAGFVKDKQKEAVYDEKGNCEYVEKEGYNYSLRYEEFIALNTMMIQKLMKEVEELKEAMRNDT